MHFIDQYDQLLRKQPRILVPRASNNDLYHAVRVKPRSETGDFFEARIHSALDKLGIVGTGFGRHAIQELRVHAEDQPVLVFRFRMKTEVLGVDVQPTLGMLITEDRRGERNKELWREYWNNDHERGEGVFEQAIRRVAISSRLTYEYEPANLAPVVVW